VVLFTTQNQFVFGVSWLERDDPYREALAQRSVQSLESGKSFEYKVLYSSFDNNDDVAAVVDGGDDDLGDLGFQQQQQQLQCDRQP